MSVILSVHVQRSPLSQVAVEIPNVKRVKMRRDSQYPTKRDHLICKCLSLSITYAATIGGLITITGTSTNLIFAEQFNKYVHVHTLALSSDDLKTCWQERVGLRAGIRHRFRVSISSRRHLNTFTVWLIFLAAVVLRLEQFMLTLCLGVARSQIKIISLHSPQSRFSPVAALSLAE